MTDERLKCCVCGKDLTPTPGISDLQWYGKYFKDQVIKAICQICIRTPGNEDWHKDE